jgi:hypothetical protein
MLNSAQFQRYMNYTIYIKLMQIIINKKKPKQLSFAFIHIFFIFYLFIDWFPKRYDIGYQEQKLS